MTTILLEEPGKLIRVDGVAPEQPAPDEALVSVRRIGVCGTDIHAFGGKQPFFSYPRILGHELGVVVEAVGPAVENVKPGDQCSVEPYINCGKCIACRRGKTNCCATMKVLGVQMDGGMRERILVPASKLHKSAKMTLDQLALVETLGIGCHAVNRAKVEAGEHALVIGAGPIGLSVIQFAIEAGAMVTVLDVNADRLAFCQRELHAPHAVNAAAENAMERVREITDGDLPTVVFDATGNPKSMMTAFGYTAQGARLVFVGLFQGDVTFNDPDFHRRELTLMGSRNALPEDFGRIIHLVETGSVDTAPWITHRGHIAGVPEVFASWTRPETGVIKAMIEVP